MQDILAVVDRFGQYSVLWDQERDAELATFLYTDPHLTDFEEKFRFYNELEEHILSEPDSVVIGPIAVHIGNVYSVLHVCYCPPLGGQLQIAPFLVFLSVSPSVSCLPLTQNEESRRPYILCEGGHVTY